MNKKATTLALLVGLVTFFYINATTYKVNELDPILYTSFGDKVTDEIKIGIEKYKETYAKLNLTNDKFYIDFSRCNGETTLLISYIPCVNECGISRLVENTNRFAKISNRQSLPVIFESDLWHSDFFLGPDGVTRVKPSRKGYAVTIDASGEIVFSNFIEY